MEEAAVPEPGKVRRPRLRSALAALTVAAVWAGTSVHAAPPRVVRDVALQRLFDRYGDAGRNDRWTGSDSAISIPLPDGRVLWTGGDTFLGTVHGDHSRDPQGFIHNCYVVQNRNGSLGPTLFTPGSGGGDQAKILSTDGQTWYWLSAGFVEGGQLRQFVIRIAGAGPAFSVVSTEIATLTLPGLNVASVTPAPAEYLPTAGGAQVYYGLAVVTEKQWTYVYGLESLGFDKYVHLARAPAGHVMDGQWTFWTGTAWSTLAAQSARLFAGGGDEMSIVKTKHGYRAVATKNSLGAEIDMWTAKNPWGPWSSPRMLYVAPEMNAQTVTYNAKEHRERDGKDYLSVSYNVNASSSNSNGLYSNVENYRPRFIRVYMPSDV